MNDSVKKRKEILSLWMYKNDVVEQNRANPMYERRSEISSISASGHSVMKEFGSPKVIAQGRQITQRT